MSDYLDELKRACSATPARSDAERIDEGESSWFAGRAAPADEGFVAIAQDDDIVTVVRERDVLEVRKKDHLFLVRVRADADVLVRFERVTKARPCDCAGHCDGGCERGGEKPAGEAPRSMARSSAAFGGDPFGPFGAPFGHCRLYIRCVYYDGIRICWWWVYCPGRVGRI